MHLIVTTASASQIDSININQGGRRSIQCREDAQGRQIIPAELLTDCGPGQTWEDYAEVLQSLEQVASVEWPPSTKTET